jgi:hypothetical protein
MCNNLKINNTHFPKANMAHYKEKTINNNNNRITRHPLRHILHGKMTVALVNPASRRDVPTVQQTFYTSSHCIFRERIELLSSSHRMSWHASVSQSCAGASHQGRHHSCICNELHSPNEFFPIVNPVVDGTYYTAYSRH